MDELPPLFQDIEFHVVWKGYDSDEVDAYVDRVAKAAALVHGRLSELQQRAEAAEERAAAGGASFGSSETEETLTRTLVLAQRTADAAIAEAKVEAAQLIASAEGQAQISTREASRAAASTIKEADDHASRVMAEAETDRRKLLADAEVEAAAAASSEHERLANEVHELEQYRAFLMEDVDLLERHLGEQRSALAESVSALKDLVERPESFRAAQAPATSGVVAPAAAHIDLTLAGRADAGAEDTGTEAELEPSAVPVPDEVAEEPFEPVAVAPITAADDEAVAADDVVTGTVVEETVVQDTVAEDAALEAVATEWEPVAEPAPAAAIADMPPVVAVDGDIEFVDVTPVAEATSEPSVEDPAEVADEQIDAEHDEPAEQDGGWTAPVSAWDEPAFAAEPTEPGPNVIDLTVSESPVSDSDESSSAQEPLRPVFDPRDLPPLDSPKNQADTATAQLDAPAPPLLVTAADFEPLSSDAPVVDELTVEEPTAPMPIVEEPLFSEPAEESSDPFLEQLRDAVAFDDIDLGDDALAAFFDQDDDPAGRGWFGRKR